MTEALYLKDGYLRECESTVTIANDKTVILDKTVFYPESGGQPGDKGVIVRGSEEFKVVFIKKTSQGISIEVDKPGLMKGDSVKCAVDWNNRYVLMRNHTAAHLLSAIIHKHTNALITGNQLGLEQSRIDFDLEDFDREKLLSYFDEANQLIEKGASVKIYFLPSEEAFKIPELFSLKGRLPPSLKELRIVEIEGVERGACGGTHLKNIKEIGKISFVKADNKGKNNRRVYFSIQC